VWTGGAVPDTVSGILSTDMLSGNNRFGTAGGYLSEKRRLRHPMDRRVARTRDLLHRALMSLILEKGYEAVTIKDICDAANVGRSTFYAHYTSKDDLKRSGLERLRKVLVDRHREALATPEDIENRTLGFSLTMFEHARDHIELYRAQVGSRGGAVALGSIRQILSDLVREELAATEGMTLNVNAADVIPRELVVHYVVGAYMAVLTWWLDGGAKLPPQRIDAMFRHLTNAGILPSDS
jgi:AcrR family transcriptional regulator